MSTATPETVEIPPGATYARAPTAASIIALVEAIEAHPAGAPAAIAFKAALTRKGREADAAGGVQALDDLLREVALSDPAKAHTRTAIERSAWSDLLSPTAAR